MKLKIKHKVKLKILFTLCLLFGGGTIFVIFYFGFDPAVLARLSFYLDLANPSMRIVRVQEGLRKEQVADIMAGKLNWDEKEKDDFINIHLALNTVNLEGRYFPKTYIIHKDEEPSGVTAVMLHEFSDQVSKINKPKSKQMINQDTAIKIASIIQREADGKNDMRLISGIIWNRLFKGMKLQMDATLQYAKGSEDAGWWKKVKSEDKKIQSSYNTYLHLGLPPGAIANPGVAAISAAYNPQKTDCLYYLHDRKGRIHCSKTYEGHKKNISIYY
ncbi:MAG: endolytic transglycosylase MltG [Candidatus Parcubacteria bacterium]|nr:endolytic transglycosylase MltG [Candidatus Parcubacteria bacterium]